MQSLPPLEVIEIVCPEKANSIEAILLKVLESVPGTVIYAKNGILSWGHTEPDKV